MHVNFNSVYCLLVLEVELKVYDSFSVVLSKFWGSSFCSFSGVMYKTKTLRKCMLTSTLFIVY